MRARVALFGGTFDPMHRAHLFIAERAHERCRLDKVIFLPCWRSPHKPGRASAPAEHRLEMARLATRDLPWAEVSSWEIDQGRACYSWETAKRFREDYPETRADLFWILGVDQWEALETWNRPELLAALVRFVVFPRHGRTPRPQARFRADFLPDALEQSATDIREMIRQGAPEWEDQMPKAEADYVKAHGLYRS